MKKNGGSAPEPPLGSADPRPHSLESKPTAVGLDSREWGLGPADPSGVQGQSPWPSSLWRDLGLFVRSARTDATLRRLGPARAAFEHIYTNQPDPWASADQRYLYQSRKYDGIVACLPPGRRFRAALDIGCGLGLLAARLAERSDQVLGLDLAQSALDRAAARTRHLPAITYRQADVSALPADLDGRFDLVAIADTLYYLPPPITDHTLAAIAARVARLLAPGGLVLLANHYFFIADPGSRLTRRIHAAFRRCPALSPRATARRCFYRVDLLALA